MIWIIGGTKEARLLIKEIKGLNNYIVTAATESSKEFLDSSNVYIGRLSYDEMVSFTEQNHIKLIVDLSHPYAKAVTDNAKKVAKDKKIDYVRYVRKKSLLDNKAICLNSYEESYDYLKNIKGTVFFTTGSKNIDEFEKARGNNRFIYRILPALESIEECKKNEISIKDIVAILGPFSKKFNKTMFSEYNADYVVMKDSGKEGGTLDKIQACNELNIIPIIIGRDEEKGIDNLEKIVSLIKNYK